MGDAKVCENYRGITLLSTVLKAYERILDKKLRDKVEHLLDEAQCGFRKGRSTQDHTFTIKQIIAKTISKGEDVFMAFLDLEKAFDTVLQQKVWESLHRRGIDQRLSSAIKSLYEDSKSYIRKDNNESSMFSIKDGLRQGGVISPTLFIILIDDIIQATKSNKYKVNIGYHRLNAVSISQCAFADDMMICTSLETSLQGALGLWEKELNSRGMKINVKKTKVMHIGPTYKAINIILNREQVEQVSKFKYLGVQIDREGKMEDEIQERIQSATNLFHGLSGPFLGNKTIKTRMKMIVHKTIFRPILTYGSESWILPKGLKSKVQAIDMKYLRKVKGVNKRDHIRNEVIKKDLQVGGIVELIEQKQLRWFGHLNRMNDDRPVKLVWQAKVQRARRRGRPKRTWNDDIAEVLKGKMMTWDQAVKMAKNKKAWTKFVYEL